MTEQEEVEILANKILDRINADPDDDLAMLSRQLLRRVEQVVRLTEERDASRQISDGWYNKNQDLQQQVTQQAAILWKIRQFVIDHVTSGRARRKAGRRI